MRVTALSVGILVMSSVAGAAPVFLGPSPYLSFSDSPFSGESFSYFHLENFESGALAAPGVAISPGAIVLGPASLTDSVDRDDGTIDGSGVAGRSLFSNAILTLFRFTFDAAALGGRLPTHAGVVWTDIGMSSAGLGFGPVSFEAFGLSGSSLGSIGPFSLGDGSFTGGTAEDRFFGVVDPNGISAIQISVAGSTDWEVDHLQYGASAVPEPGTWVLALTGLGTLPFIRRRRLGPVPFE